MLDRHARGARSGSERKWGTSARLAVLVAALVLAIGSCGLADPVSKSRTDSMRGASWPGADTDEVPLDGVAILHTGTPSPDPTVSPPPFFSAFDPPDGARTPDGEPVPQAPDRTFWPLPAPDEPEYGELGHSPAPDPGTDPCEAVGVLPDECDPEPEPSPCDDSGESCEPPACEDADGCTPPDCDGEPTSEPTAEEDSSGTGGDGEPTPDPTGSPDPTQTPAPTQSPEPTQSPDPTPSQSPSDPPDDGEPGC